MKVKEAAAEMLALNRVAVTGVSRHPEGHGANVVFNRLLERGYAAYPVNPNASEVEGTVCYPDLAAIPGGVDWVLIGTRPEAATGTMLECLDLGIKHVWMHRAFGTGSVSADAARLGREHGVEVIDGGCPLMFEPTADGGHKVIRAFCSLTGAIPKTI